MGARDTEVGTAAHPLLALGVIPERTDHLPAVAMIGRTKQTARQRAAPDPARFVATAGLQRPDARGAPCEWTAPHVGLFDAFGLRRVCRGRDLFPPRCRRTVQFDAEMAVIERRVVAAAAVIGQRESDVVAQEVYLFDGPVPVLPPGPRTALCESRRGP
jgi:hypothetical protein